MDMVYLLTEPHLITPIVITLFHCTGITEHSQATLSAHKQTKPGEVCLCPLCVV